MISFATEGRIGLRHFALRLSTGIVLVLASCCTVVAQTSVAAVTGAGYESPTPLIVAPAQVLTFFIHGVASPPTTPIWANTIPLPTSLGGISAGYGDENFALPLSMISVQPINPCGLMQPGCNPYIAVTAQIPYNINAENPTVFNGVPPSAAQILFHENDQNGSTLATVYVFPFVDSAHVLRTCDLVFPSADTICSPVVTHSSGRVVSGDVPAKEGETITIWAVGLGRVVEPSPTPTGQPFPAASPTVFPFQVRFDVRQGTAGNSSGAFGAVSYAGSAPGFVGLYQINVAVPSFPSVAPCVSMIPPITGFLGIQAGNATVTISGLSSSDTFNLCVQP